MKQNVNFVLFGLLLLTIISIFLMGLYYRSTYVKLNAKYRDAIDEVNDFADELNMTLIDVRAKEDLLNKKEKELADYVGELNLSKERETFLGEHFTELKDEKVGIEQNLNATMREKEECLGLYYDVKQEFTSCNIDLTSKTSQLRIANREIQRIQIIGINIQTSASDLSSTMVAANNEMDDIKDRAEDIDSNVADIDDADLRGSIESDLTRMENDINALGRKLEDIQTQVNTITNNVDNI